MNAIPGATFDSNTGLIEIPTRSISLMQPLHFKIADHVLTMDVAAQLIPTDQNKEWGGVAGKQYGVVGKTRENSGKGFDFVLGVAFMQRYYTVSSGLSFEKRKLIKITFGRYSTHLMLRLDLLRRKCWSMLNLFKSEVTHP